MPGAEILSKSTIDRPYLCCPARLVQKGKWPQALQGLLFQRLNKRLTGLMGGSEGLSATPAVPLNLDANALGISNCRHLFDPDPGRPYAAILQGLVGNALGQSFDQMNMAG